MPTCRPEKYDDFMRAWEPLFNRHGVAVYAVRDEPASWETWPEWVPRQSDQCRSYGFWQAWRDGCDYTLSLDDDVRPLIGVDVFAEYEAAFDRGWPCTPYLSVGALTDSGREMRGFPYEGRQARCVVQYGGWDGVLDYDGRTQLDGAPLDSRFAETVIPVPRGVAVTTCAMNVAFRTEFTPFMWQLPVLPDGRYKRWGDIWSGLVQKDELDRRDEVMLINGRASVLHDRASDPARNAALEAPGMKINELVWNGITSGHWPFLGGIVPRDWADYYWDCRQEWMALFAGKPVAA